MSSPRLPKHVEARPGGAGRQHLPVTVKKRPALERARLPALGKGAAELKSEDGTQQRGGTNQDTTERGKLESFAGNRTHLSLAEIEL